MSSSPISLYRQMLRAATKFSSYNFRHYAVRRVRDGFLAGRSLTEPSEVSAAIKEAQESLEMLKRQSTISGMYQSEKLVIETRA